MCVGGVVDMTKVMCGRKTAKIESALSLLSAMKPRKGWGNPEFCRYIEVFPEFFVPGLT